MSEGAAINLVNDHGVQSQSVSKKMEEKMSSKPEPFRYSWGEACGVNWIKAYKELALLHEESNLKVAVFFFSTELFPCPIVAEEKRTIRAVSGYGTRLQASSLIGCPHSRQPPPVQVSVNGSLRETYEP